MPRWAGKFPSCLMLPEGNKIFLPDLLIPPLRTDWLKDMAGVGKARFWEER